LFHIRIAEATGNSVLVGLVTQLFDARLGPLFNRLHSHFDNQVVWNQAVEEHGRVMKALRAKDPDMARAAMQRHMDISFKRYSANLTGHAKEKRRRSKRTAAGKKAVAVKKTPAVLAGSVKKRSEKARV